MSMPKSLNQPLNKSLNQSLKQLLNDVLAQSGIQKKFEIQDIAMALQDAMPNLHHPNGDDAAAIRNENGYDLIAGEGFLTEFVARDPWFAGWCSIMVNVSDIAAMGGRPIAVTNTIWSTPSDKLDQIYQGMSAASRVFNVPIVGGHTNLSSNIDSNTKSNVSPNMNYLAVSIYGRANKLLSSFAARPDHALVAAIDLRGSFREPFLNWNAATTAPPNRLCSDLELLPKIAESGLAMAAKDISQAGILGTCLMLLESSNVGAVINLNDIPKPQEIPWLDWLCCFPSFGYLFTTPQSKLDALLTTFKDQDIDACCIGSITQKKQVIIQQDHQTELFWNLDEQAITGFNDKNPSQSFSATNSTTNINQTINKETSHSHA